MRRQFEQDLKKFIKANYRDLDSRKEIYAVIKLMADDKYVKPKRLQECLVNYVNDVEEVLEKSMRMALISVVNQQAEASINDKEVEKIANHFYQKLLEQLK